MITEEKIIFLRKFTRAYLLERITAIRLICF